MSCYEFQTSERSIANRSHLVAVTFPSPVNPFIYKCMLLSTFSRSLHFSSSYYPPKKRRCSLTSHVHSMYKNVSDQNMSNSVRKVLLPEMCTVSHQCISNCVFFLCVSVCVCKGWEMTPESGDLHLYIRRVLISSV